MKGVIYQKMSGVRDGARLFRPCGNLAPDETEARLYFEFVQNGKQVLCDPACGSIIEGEQAMAKRQTTLVARDKDRTRAHALVARSSEGVAPQKLPDKRRRRLFTNLRRGTNLLDSSSVHHHDTVCQFERFILVVRDKECGDF